MLPVTMEKAAAWNRAGPLAAGVGYLFVFLALYGAAGAFEISSGVSTWYPAAGLRLAVLLLLGWRFGLVIAVAETVAGVLLGIAGLSQWDSAALMAPDHLAGKLLQGWIPPFFYTLAAFLAFRWLRFDGGLATYRDVLSVCLVGVAASFATALFSCLNLAANGFMAWTDVASMIPGFWTGDMIGVLTLAPAILVGASLPRWRSTDCSPGFFPESRWILMVEAALVVLFVAVTFVWADGYGSPLRWYPFFLPIIWVSLRFGIAGAAAGTLMVNTVVAMLAALAAGQAVPQDVQGLMIMLSVAGLLIGSVVWELRAERASLDRRVRERTAELRSEVIRRKSAEEHALRERDRAKNYLAIAKALIVALDRDARITLINQEGCAVLGYADDEVAGRDWFELAVPEEERARARANHDRLFDGSQPGSQRFQSTLQTRTGERRVVEWRVTVITGEGETPAGTLSSGLDITERVGAEQRMRYLATHDATTGLNNRNWLRDHLGAAIARARRRESLLGVLFLDLDGFKRINDDFGHDAGDAVLSEVARRLTACVREVDGVIRFGGDEFIVVLEDLAGQRDGTNVARKILRALSESVSLENRSVRISASIGIAFFPEHGATMGALLNAADAAMYLAKKGGRNRYRLARDRGDRSGDAMPAAGE